MRFVVLVLFSVLIMCGEAGAVSSPTPEKTAVPVVLKKGDFSQLKLVVPRARVKDVVDGITLVIENGRGETATLRLAGVWVPWENQETGGDTMKAATEALSKQFKGHMVRVYQSKNATPATLSTPLGHSKAMVEREDGVWAQGSLLALGLAYVSADPVFKGMTPQLTATESQARVDKLGLWGNPKWQALEAADSKFAKGQFRVVEGRVYSTFSKNNRIYLAFGPNAKEDLTLVVSAAKRLEFARANINLMGLNTKKLEARGFIQDLDGPVLVVETVEDLKIIP